MKTIAYTIMNLFANDKQSTAEFGIWFATANPVIARVCTNEQTLKENNESGPRVSMP